MDILQFINDNLEKIYEKKNYLLYCINSYDSNNSFIKYIKEYYKSNEQINYEQFLYNMYFFVFKDTNIAYHEWLLSNLSLDKFFIFLENRYGRHIGNKIKIEFNRMLNDIDDLYHDNYRVCKIGNLEEEKIYNSILEKGCCGFEDREIIIDNTKYNIGCNFGH